MVIMISMSMISDLMYIDTCNWCKFPPTAAWKAHATSGSLNVQRPNLILSWVGFLVFFRRTRKVIIIMVASLICPRKAPCLMMLTPERSASSPRCGQSDCGVSPLGCVVHLLDSLRGPRVFASSWLLKIANSWSLGPLSFVSSLQ